MENEAEKIVLTDEDGEQIELYVLEETKINGRNYLLLAEEMNGDSEAYIFREETSEEEEEAAYVPVEDDTEYDAVLKVFEELLDDTDFA